jgi:hypothetical protein
LDRLAAPFDHRWRRDIADSTVEPLFVVHADVLRRLAIRAEAEAGVGQSAIEAARGRLLRAAREVAGRTGRRLADVILDASGGMLRLESLKALGDCDVTRVESAIQRLCG